MGLTGVTRVMRVMEKEEEEKENENKFLRADGPMGQSIVQEVLADLKKQSEKIIGSKF